MSTDNLKAAFDSHFVALKMLKHLEKKKINVHGNLCFKLMSGSDISEVVWVLICFFTNNALLKDAISSLTLNEDI